MIEMNINKTLLEGIRDELSKYGCEYEDVKNLLFNEKRFPEKQKKAIEIIRKTIEKHGKEEIGLPMGELARIEYGIREVEPWLRDHVVHATLSFFLGIYINKKLLSDCVDKFQWKLAGLFHDIGYPVEVAGSLLRSFSGKINEIKRDYNGPSQHSYFNIVPVSLDNLTNDLNGLTLIQECLNRWKLHINATEEYKQMFNSESMCHGVLSSLIILNVIDAMYQKHNPGREHRDIFDNNFNWNQENFDEYIIPACSAIFIHNLPKRCFAHAKIKLCDAPVAFLLKLSDCLQEWERPSFKNDSAQCYS
jgi:hypothetical protein